MRAGRPAKNGNAARPFPTLRELKISKRQSAEWQRLAAIPEADFEAIMHHGRTAERLTTGGILREWEGTKRRRVASLERMAAELRAAGWTVFPPHAGDRR
ncbi:MAG: hypothetical protein ACREE4_23635 [Stellaceae bacterium]